MRKALIYNKKDMAGVLTETDDGYLFQYDSNYLAMPNTEPISLTMPLSPLPYKSKVLFPFFDTDISILDRMSLLLLCCKDCIGAVSVVPLNEENHE